MTADQHEAALEQRSSAAISPGCRIRATVSRRGSCCCCWGSGTRSFRRSSASSSCILRSASSASVLLPFAMSSQFKVHRVWFNRRGGQNTGYPFAKSEVGPCVKTSEYPTLNQSFHQVIPEIFGTGAYASLLTFLRGHLEPTNRCQNP